VSIKKKLRYRSSEEKQRSSFLEHLPSYVPKNTKELKLAMNEE